MKTVLEAAKLADEYALVHREREYRTRGDYKGDFSQSFPANKRGEEATKSHPGKHIDNRSVQNSYDIICNYCKHRGHYKAECPNKFKAKAGPQNLLWLLHLLKHQ